MGRPFQEIKNPKRNQCIPIEIGISQIGNKNVCSAMFVIILFKIIFKVKNHEQIYLIKKFDKKLTCDWPSVVGP